MWTPSRAWLDDPVLLVVYALATYRLTRLVVADTILDRPRDWIARRSDRWGLFITCPWCTSIWLAAGWALLATLAPPVAWFAGAVLAFSAVAGLLAGRE